MTEILDLKSRIYALCSIPSNFLNTEDVIETRSGVLSLLDELKEKTNYNLTDDQAIEKWHSKNWKEVWSDFYRIIPLPNFIKVHFNECYHHQLNSIGSNGVRWNFHDADFFGIPISLLLKSLYTRKNNFIEFTFSNIIFGLPLPKNSDISDFTNFINGGGLWGLNLWFKRPLGIIGLKFELHPIYVDDDFRVDNLILKNYTDRSGNLLQGSNANYIVLYTKKDYF